MLSTTPTDGVPSLSLRSLTKFYGAHLGVEDISLDVKPGEVMGFLGPNGSGKTTVIRMLTGLIRVTRGEAEILGRRVGHRDPLVRNEVGYLPGSLGLHDNLTGRQYFRFLADVRDRATPDRRRPSGRGRFGSTLRRADEICEQLGLDPGVRIGSMSKGTRQKVGVVQAFMHRPRVLILDEPTSGLDPLVQRAFVALLEDSRREGAAVLLSSHVMHEVETLATHVTIILKGRQVLVDEIASLRRRVQRTLVFDFDHDVRTDQFEGCAHVVSVTGGGRTVTCTVSGPETEVLRTAAALGAHTVNSSEPSLEDLFYSVTGAGDVH